MYGGSDSRDNVLRQIGMMEQIIKGKMQRMREEWTLTPVMRSDHGDYHECKAMIITLDTIQKYLDEDHLLSVVVRVEGCLVKLYSSNESIHKKLRGILAQNGYTLISVDDKAVNKWYPRIIPSWKYDRSRDSKS